MIRVRQLEVLCAVIDLGTTSGAAKMLSVSQPAVSNMIRHIEDVVGFPLFLREKGRLTPTPEALHIARVAQHLFSQKNRIEEVITQLRDGTIGRLNVIATPSIGYVLLPRLISEFTRKRPGVKLSVEFGSIDEIIQRLIGGRADLGLSITSPNHSALSVQPMAEGEMVCVCHRDHPLAREKTVNVLDLNKVRHISYSLGSPLGQLIHSVFSNAGVERRYYCEVRHTSTALEMVAAGAGVALIDSFALMGRPRDDIVARPTTPTLQVTMHCVTSNLYPTSNIALQFQAFMRKHLQNAETLARRR